MSSLQYINSGTLCNINTKYTWQQYTEVCVCLDYTCDTGLPILSFEGPDGLALVLLPWLQQHLVPGIRVVDGIRPCLSLKTHSTILDDRQTIFPNVGAIQEVARVELHSRLVSVEPQLMFTWWITQTARGRDNYTVITLWYKQHHVGEM